jgi:hypothetical protein
MDEGIEGEGIIWTEDQTNVVSPNCAFGEADLLLHVVVTARTVPVDLQMPLSGCIGSPAVLGDPDFLGSIPRDNGNHGARRTAATADEQKSEQTD